MTEAKVSRAAGKKLSRQALGFMGRADFVAILGDVFEHSPWVADEAWAPAPYAGVDGLHEAMVGAVRRAGPDRQLTLIRAHPDLAGKAAVAGDLTEDSRREQAGAGLDQCTAEEFARFQTLNDRYKDKFGFPFIIAVKGAGRAEILDSFAERLQNDRNTEFNRALDEIARIARFRLDALLEE
jgi:2-oxo-4-hydroxy-4-carboxy-5-ureidoimidazoline decarboxylase